MDENEIERSAKGAELIARGKAQRRPCRLFRAQSNVFLIQGRRCALPLCLFRNEFRNQERRAGCRTADESGLQSTTHRSHSGEATFDEAKNK